MPSSPPCLLTVGIPNGVGCSLVLVAALTSSFPPRGSWGDLDAGVLVGIAWVPRAAQQMVLL